MKKIYLSVAMAALAVIVTACESTSTGSSSSELPEATLVDNADSTFGSLKSTFADTSFTPMKQIQHRLHVGPQDTPTQSPDDPLCDIHGDPWDASLLPSAGDMIQSNNLFAYQLFHCLASLPQGGPDTVRGSFELPKAIVCAASSALGGNVTYSSGGTVYNHVTVAIASPCFNAELISEINVSSIDVDSITFTALDPSTGFDKEIDLENASPALSEKVYFFHNTSSGNDIYGFKTVEGATSPGAGGSVSVTIDRNNGIILYNNIDDRGGPSGNGGQGPDSLYRRITRIRIVGTIDPTTNEVTGVTNASGLWAQSGSATVYSDLDTNFSIAALGGTGAAGFQTETYSYASSTLDPQSGGCYPNGSTCVGQGITVDGAGATNYYQTNSGWANFIQTGAPLCDDSQQVSTAALPSTGLEGVCP